MAENEELAKRIAAATLSYQMGTTYQTAYKNFCEGKPIGTFWLELADTVQRGMAENASQFLSKAIK
jgi:hypothetical protein